MRLDHFVVNIDRKYQKDKEIIEKIRKCICYEPTWGKGTKGFKVSNLWIGNEYLELVHILKKDGGGWLEEWTKRFNQGHRGMICLMLDVENIDLLYQDLKSKDIAISNIEWLEFKWFFNLLTRRMPWRNCYLPFFENVPFQIGFQQMKDAKSYEFMKQYMVPNSRDMGIEGIYKIVVYGDYSKNDFNFITKVFGDRACVEEESIKIKLNDEQVIEFVKGDYYVELYTNCSNGQKVSIENLTLYC